MLYSKAEQSNSKSDVINNKQSYKEVIKQNKNKATYPVHTDLFQTHVQLKLKAKGNIEF